MNIKIYSLYKQLFNLIFFDGIFNDIFYYIFVYILSLYSTFIMTILSCIIFIYSLASIFRNSIAGCGRPGVSYHLLERPHEVDDTRTRGQDILSLRLFRSLLPCNPWRQPCPIDRCVYRTTSWQCISHSIYLFSARETGISSIKY